MEEKKNKAWSWINAALITAFTFFLSHYIIYDISSLSVFSPMEKSNDFVVSDLYQTNLSNRMVSSMSNDIVIVSVDGCNRQEIADILTSINECKPKGVFLDIFFNEEYYDEDQPLIEALNSTQKLYLPEQINIGKDSASLLGSYFYPELGSNVHYGASNLSANSMRDVIRSFHPFFSSSETGGVQLQNIVSEIAMSFFPEQYDVLMSRNNEEEMISFSTTEFMSFSSDEIINGIDDNDEPFIRDKIIFIGNIDDKSDMYLTPVSYELSGLEIHAHALDTIINGTYERYSSKALLIMITIILVFWLVRFNIFARHHLKYSGKLFIRIAQLALMYFCVVFGVFFYVKKGLTVDFSITLLMLGLNILATDIWYGLLGLVRFVIDKVKK